VLQVPLNSNQSINLGQLTIDVNKANRIKAKASIPKAKDYQLVSRPGEGKVQAFRSQVTTTGEGNWNFKNYNNSHFKWI